MEKGKVSRLFLEFTKAKVKIATNYGNYYNYLRLYFDKIIDKKAGGDVPVEVDVCWVNNSVREYFKDLIKKDSFFQLGANTFVNKANHRVIAFRKIAKRIKVVFDFTKSDRKIYLKVFFQRKIFRDFMRYSIGRKHEEEMFFEVTYPTLYYPLFWYLEYSHNTHILHASAIEHNNKSIVICGLEGIGKTSLSLSLLDKDRSFISDNLIFYDKENIYSCFELLRINIKDDTSSWAGKIRKINAFRTPKDFYQPVSLVKNKGIRPSIFIFPKFGEEFYVEKITKKSARNKSITLSQLPAELRNYNEYANLYNLLNIDFSVWESRYNTLFELLNDVNCYEVTMPKSSGLEKNSAMLKSFINNV